MKRRGRYATFPASGAGAGGHDDIGATLSQESRWRFSVIVEGGAKKIYDLSKWGYPAFTASVVPLVIEMVRRMGPAPVVATVNDRILDLRRFWRFLEDRAIHLRNIDDVTVDLLASYEDWLGQNTRTGIRHRQILSPLLRALRLVVELEPQRLSASLVARLKYLSHVEGSGVRSRDAYSGAVTASLRGAALMQVAAAQSRLILDDGVMERPPAIEAHPALHRMYDDTIAAIIRDGWVSSDYPPRKRLNQRAYRRRVEIIEEEVLHGRFYLTKIDMTGFLILLSLETGMELECLLGLKADCLRNPSQGYVEVEYRKRRSHGAQWKRLRVRDGASSTPGAILRTLIKLTARARMHLCSERLFAWWNGYRLVTDGRSNATAAMFVARHDLVDDEGKPLHLVLPRLRKTQKAEHYIRTNGQLEAFATGHTIAVAARHYADIPALRHIHEQAVADAFQDALDAALKPHLVQPEDERLKVTGDEAEGSLTMTPALLDGEQDLWLASCANFYDSPFGSSEDGCATSFWGCLECSNAVITARKLPALIAFETFMVDQRTNMTESEWRAKFGRAHHRINAQIIPAFPEPLVAEARSLAEVEGSGLLYMPLEAYP